jgi:CRP-like cAMP-binding protein
MTSRRFQDAVLDRCDLLAFPAGASVYHAGDEAGSVYGILDGYVELHFPSTGGGATLAHIASAGSWLGNLAAVRRLQEGLDRRIHPSVHSRLSMAGFATPRNIRMVRPVVPRLVV